MTTALKMIQRAFSKAGIKPAETPLSDSEVQDGLDALNDMLSAWDSTDILKGVPLMDDVNDTVECPRYAEWAIKSNLAIILNGEYRTTVSPALLSEAKESYNKMVSANSNMQDIDFPSTLPIGTGNNDELRGGFDRDFFPENDVRNF